MPEFENPFETRAGEYDAWFDANRTTFRNELDAVRSILPEGSDRRRWVEIGVGSGRFAEALCIPLGVEPAGGMAALARERGIDVRQGTAESLPLPAASYAAVFLITSLCFIDDAAAAFREASRILTLMGHVVVAFLPCDSPFGRVITAARESDPFFRYARLWRRDEVVSALDEAGLRIDQAVHTLTGEPKDWNTRIEAPSPGWIDGSFVVLRARKGTLIDPHRKPPEAG